MKILFLSDIHGVTNNLNKIKNIIENNNIDKIVVLGDLYYPANNNIDGLNISVKEVKEFLTNYKDKLICMKGNCDSLVDIKTSNFIINEGISLLNIDNINIYITHGDLYSYTLNDKLIDKTGVLVYGHEHIPYIKQYNNMTYINTGSISLPRNGYLPSYCIYQNKEFIIYDIYNNIIDKITIN